MILFWYALGLFVSLGWLVIGLAHDSRPVLAFRRRAERIHARDLERGKRKVDLQAPGLWPMATRTRAIATGLLFAAATFALPVLSVQSSGTDPSMGTIAVDIRYEGGPPTLDDSPRPSAPGRIWVNSNDYDQIASLDVGEGQVLLIPVDPGTYRVGAESGDARCHEHKVVVEAGQVSKLHVICEVF